MQASSAGTGRRYANRDSRISRGISGASRLTSSPCYHHPAMSILVVNRKRPHLLIAGIALVLLLSLVVLRIPVTMVFVGFSVMLAAIVALIRPEIGLHVLVFNAMVGLTHIVEMPSVGPFSAPVLIEALVLGAIFFHVAFFGLRVPFGTRQHLL